MIVWSAKSSPNQDGLMNDFFPLSLPTVYYQLFSRTSQTQLKKGLFQKLSFGSKLLILQSFMDKVLAKIRKVVQTQRIFKPLLVTDIDGVLVRGNNPIPGTKESLRSLKMQQIPLACLTNGGGVLQQTKAQKMNEIFKEDFFDGDHMFMAHSPIRPYLSKYYKEGLLLITGSNKIEEIVKDMNISNYITADQLYSIFHSSDSLPRPHHTLAFRLQPGKVDEITSRIKQRLKRDSLPSNYHEWGQQVSAIFALNDVSPYQKALQIIHNIFLQKTNRKLPLPPYFAAQNDIAWAGGYHRPRIAFGPFNYMLEDHCSRHGFQLNKLYFGKPQKVAFQFVGNLMKERYGEGCYFMFGDNPRADIKGANQIGWISFLTQTGVHAGANNDDQNPATMVVSTFKEAVDLILKIKKQKLYE